MKQHTWNGREKGCVSSDAKGRSGFRCFTLDSMTASNNTIERPAVIWSLLEAEPRTWYGVFLIHLRIYPFKHIYYFGKSYFSPSNKYPTLGHVGELLTSHNNILLFLKIKTHENRFGYQLFFKSVLCEVWYQRYNKQFYVRLVTLLTLTKTSSNIIMKNLTIIPQQSDSVIITL